MGGVLRPNYSHVSQPISDLVASGAPNKSLLDPLFALYNLLVMALAVGLWQRVRAEGESRRKTVGTIGAVMLLLEGLFGIITLFFPEDAGSIAEATATGKLHVVFAALSSLTTMLTMLLLGFWFRAVARLRRCGLYSFVSLLVVFVSGGLAAAGVATNSPLAGLLERITIGGFMQWTFVIARRLYRDSSDDAPET